MNLAQLNVAELLAPLDDPMIADFTNNIARINALGEQHDGFIWRLKDEDNDDIGATSFRIPNQENLIVNMSLWQDYKSLRDFVFKTEHAAFYRRRYEWFSKMSQHHFVMWHVPKGHIPSLEEAWQKKLHLDAHGETPEAFQWKGAALYHE
jgi:hypothetical protein